MRRFSLWLRGKPMVADSMLAFALFVLDALTAPQAKYSLLFVAMGACIAAPVVFRRSHPRLVAWSLVMLSITTTVITHFLDDYEIGHPSLLGLGIALYTLVAYVGRRDAAIFVLALIIDAALALWLLEQSLTEVGGFIAVFYALCWITAEFMGARTAYDQEVAARLAVADYDRERSAHEAVIAERTRIARELHDVVAHAVSVMVVQADGASYALRQNPAAAETALANISSTGREALGELRRTVALLRTDETPEQMPQHGSAGIARVAEMMQRAGLTVEVQQTGQLDDIPPRVSLGVHRIVQESLTNVLRHAGPNARARVEVERRATDVLVEIVDTGRSAPPPNAFTGGGGNGLVGMRERVAVLHGTLIAGRLAGGGWRVRAVLPLDLPD
ncbi:sensor histidine kinase [Antrihabitans sp. YC2-6]|uniref:sensor histidine kinase n=1 Tax=Antrihabitans sp. YC2-6 TaxID=2799498 RepID=UPI0018F45608|nr:histidine kinase [Antrihabitans sp. YC2-6]MBJ8345561.1 sensor histidine kinase [Antrihabitans sp. YC2-6]